jgi:hypothetical protein
MRIWEVHRLEKYQSTGSIIGIRSSEGVGIRSSEGVNIIVNSPIVE